jgi:NADH:ubiquinone oxidoreductase subunit C
MNIRERVREELAHEIKGWVEASAKRIYFSIDKQDILKAAEVLFKKLSLRFIIATATDTLSGFEILYHFSYDPAGEIYTFRVELNGKERCEVPSIARLFPGAEWIEREIWEMLGINFKGHPNLKRLLLADEWPEGVYPLRKDS